MSMSKWLWAFVILISMNSQASIWEDSQGWDSQWEEKYNHWVQMEYSEDIFMTGKYKGVPTDCADAVYAARAIFAFENSLPFAIKDSTGGRRMITNKMNRFNSIEDQVARFKRFLLYIFDMTNTKSLPLDTYPVEISREFVKPGGTWVRPRRQMGRLFGSAGAEVQPGHAELIKEVKETGVIYFIGSTVPQANRVLHYTNDLIFLPENTKSGLRYFLQPEMYSWEKEEIPGYSLEQFEMGQDGRKRKLKAWRKEIYKRLQMREESIEETKFRYAENFCEKMKARVSIILKSEKERYWIHNKLDRCMNEREYDLYSTPSRDGKAKKVLKELLRMEYKTGFLTKRRIRKMNKYFEACGDLEYMPGKTMPMVEAAILIYKEKMSTDPNQEVEARWGLKREKNLDCKKYY